MDFFPDITVTFAKLSIFPVTIEDIDISKVWNSSLPQVSLKLMPQENIYLCGKTLSLKI